MISIYHHFSTPPLIIEIIIGVMMEMMDGPKGTFSYIRLDYLM